MSYRRKGERICRASTWQLLLPPTRGREEASGRSRRGVLPSRDIAGRPDQPSQRAGPSPPWLRGPPEEAEASGPSRSARGRALRRSGGQRGRRGETEQRQSRSGGGGLGAPGPRCLGLSAPLGAAKRRGGEGGNASAPRSGGEGKWLQGGADGAAEASLRQSGGGGGAWSRWGRRAGSLRLDLLR